uniref:Chromosome 11 open reading frame 16 n=2 Tax=Loxodonta africana TaxID=9785 RepID=G3T621_LOXAF
MDSSTGPGMPLPKYCSMTTTLKAPCWDSAAPPWDLSFTCPFALRTPWLTRHNLLTRYVSYHPCLHITDPAWQEPGWLGRVGDAADPWVLARREPDGFYYRAQIKPAPELERQGTLFVEFEAPAVTGPKQPAQQHGVVLEEEVIQLSPPMAYSLRPGDKVLAPWEPNGQRYGPGTVLLGLETRDPQRVSKDEEITVHFWNGKTAKVPLGGVRWVPLTVWKAAVEKLHKPFTREHPSPLLWAPCCTLLGSATGYVTKRLPLGTPFLCPFCHPHACCQLLCQGCLCCCPLAGPTWWPLTRTSEVTARELPEPELKPTAQLLPLEGPKEEDVAVHVPMAVSSSSSSSSEEEDLGKDLEMGPPQRLMVNSTVNTGPIPPEKSPRQSGFCQPEWRYWRRNGPEPRPRKPGI